MASTSRVHRSHEKTKIYLIEHPTEGITGSKLPFTSQNVREAAHNDFQRRQVFLGQS